MKNIIKNITATLLLVVGLGVVLTPTIYASPASDSCDVLKSIDDTVTCDSATSKEAGNNIAIKVINILSVVTGSIAVIMVIIGGVRYVISAGDSNAVQGAKNTIMYALVGLVVVLFAQVIVRFVLSTATNPTPTP